MNYSGYSVMIGLALLAVALLLSNIIISSTRLNAAIDVANGKYHAELVKDSNGEFRWKIVQGPMLALPETTP